MAIRRIAVLGGGPGGLYAARLLKLADPRREIDVYEQGEPGKTFGFGVGLASRTQRNLADADPDTIAEIVAAAHGHGVEMRVGSRTARINPANLLAIARTSLLDVLRRHAEAAGVRVHFGGRKTAADLDADLLIAADGVSSATREAAAADFGATIEVGAGLYLWCGTDFALPTAMFAPLTTEHGTFVTHAYPYAPDRSTFLIETDEKTWRNAGFDDSTEQTPWDASDEVSIGYLQEAFAEYLRGHHLIGNRTRWLRFRTVRCRSWHHGRTVLLGDAAHTAHYSIGSGTKLAMEDSIALTQALNLDGDLPDLLGHYERQRRPGVAHLQSIAHRSQLWWESFPTRTDLPVEQLTVAYMTRAGKVPVDRFRQASPQVATAALVQYAQVPAADVPAGDVDDWVLSRPLAHGGRRFGSRVLAADDPLLPRLVRLEYNLADAWGAEADALAQRAARDRHDGAAGFLLTGADARDSVLNRLEFAERLRLLTGALVVVEAATEYRADVVAGLVSGRVDLAAVPSTAAPNM
ncbi:FAD-dependent monooxygenase [Nocardia aurea]|uniref:FAD-dependent monooxygenase n=1 Tax=Nocardia aurea TaxID=2144174 RepID=UPI000D690575|nr:FAD-dependent monooxygenase [Nocardia aurea]